MGVLTCDDVLTVSLWVCVAIQSLGEGDRDLMLRGAEVGGTVGVLEEGDQSVDSLREDGEVQCVEAVEVMGVIIPRCLGESEERGNVEVGEDGVEEF